MDDEHEGAGQPTSVASEVREQLWVLVVAGIPTGVVVAGVGSRLAMYLLRLTSPDRVRGLTSDDGFEIGRFTLGGSYNLLMLGAAVGLIGAAAYRAVAPWLIGPRWFRRLTVASASGVVVGSMLVHEDGIDFQVLEPRWLAVGLFVALPAVFGVAIAAAVDRAAARALPEGWRRRALPVLIVVAFPFVIPLVLVAALWLAVWIPTRRAVTSSDRLRRITGVPIRVSWAAIATLGLVALVRDIQALT